MIKNFFNTGHFFFLRHGESVNNRLNIVNGWTDCELTKKGVAQAENAAIDLGSYEVDKIYVSDLKRAVSTAEIIARVCRIKSIEVVPELRERNWGEFENQPRDKLLDIFITPSNGESWSQYYERVKNALNSLKINEKTLIVGHAGTMRVLNVILGLADLKDRVLNSQLIKIEKDLNGWKINS